MLPSPKPITPFNLCRANETDIVHIRQLPVRQQVETKEHFIETVRYVHAMGHYHNQERATDNWLSADVIALDIDNDVNQHLHGMNLKIGQLFNNFKQIFQITSFGLLNQKIIIKTSVVTQVYVLQDLSFMFIFPYKKS